MARAKEGSDRTRSMSAERRRRRKSPSPQRRKSEAKSPTKETEKGISPEEEKSIAWKRTRDVLILFLVVTGPALFIIANFKRDSILASLVISVLGFVATCKIIPTVAKVNLKRNMFGKDINKRGTPAGEIPIPESLGLATGLIHIVCIVFFQLIHTHLFHERNTEDVLPENCKPIYFFGFLPETCKTTHGMDDWTEKWLIQYNSALASITLMLFLGFADDVLDIPWRTKLLLPSIAALPVLAAYTGSTAILLPKPLRSLVGADLLDLSVLYLVYMLLLIVFCTNSINILAGINGLEASQTLVIASATLTFNVLRLSGVVDIPSLSAEDIKIRNAQLFSVYITLPLIAVTVALLLFNYYPSRVFVGDSYTYFAGMALAVCGILGHFSETLLIFFIPQILNFLYSCPQLFKIVPCPRHRLPVFDKKTGLLHPSKRADGGYNLNLVTLFLRMFGPCTEKQLCNRLIAFQVFCCSLGFLVRFMLEGIYK